MPAFDFVIVGAGSAGCVLANRLSVANARVLLVEAGPRDRSPMIKLPAGAGHVFSSTRYAWQLDTVPQAGLDGRRIRIPQGRTLGGSSAINAMVYSRGSPADYDEWANELGCRGWGWDDLLPHFKALERHSMRGLPDHGRDGQLVVSDQVEVDGLTEAFLEAGQAQGLPLQDDLARASQVGIGLLQHTVRRGRRFTTAHAFLHPVTAKRPGLAVRTDSQAVRLLVRRGRVAGVVLAGPQGEETVEAGEVILSAGAVGTPKLLLLSGIGPAAELAALGIEVTHDLPGVGRGLADHLHLPIVMGCNAPVGIDRRRAMWRLPLEAVRYAVSSKGLLAIRVLQAAAYTALEPGTSVPELALHFIPMRLADARHTFGAGPGMTIHAALLRPHSRGSVRLASADPAAPALIDPGYLSDGRDLAGAVACFTQSQDLFEEPALRRWIDRPLLPAHRLDDGKEIEAFVRANGETDYHLASSCRMGVGEEAVVDPVSLRLRGLEGVRLCCSSILPTLVRGNTNAVVTAMASRAAELIAGGGVIPRPVPSGPPVPTAA